MTSYFIKYTVCKIGILLVLPKPLGFLTYSGYEVMEILKHKILEFTFTSKTFGQLTEKFHYFSLFKYCLYFKEIVIFMHSFVSDTIQKCHNFLP